MADTLGKLLGVGNELFGLRIPSLCLVTPTVIDVDVLITKLPEAKGSQFFGDPNEHVLCDVASKLIPRTPAQSGKASSTVWTD
jgi:hypothetical protein